MAVRAVHRSVHDVLGAARTDAPLPCARAAAPPDADSSAPCRAGRMQWPTEAAATEEPPAERRTHQHGRKRRMTEQH